MLWHRQVQALVVEVITQRRLRSPFLRFLLLARSGVRLRELARRRIFVPTPFLLEVFVDEADLPAGFFVDLVEDLEDFFLLVAFCEHFGCVGQGADGY